LDEGITKKIQSFNDKCINEFAAYLFMNAVDSAAQRPRTQRAHTCFATPGAYGVLCEARTINAARTGVI